MQDWWLKLETLRHGNSQLSRARTAGETPCKLVDAWTRLLVQSQTPMGRCFKRTRLQYTRCIAFANVRMMKYDPYDGESNPDAGEEQQEPEEGR